MSAACASTKTCCVISPWPWTPMKRVRRPCCRTRVVPKAKAVDFSAAAVDAVDAMAATALAAARAVRVRMAAAATVAALIRAGGRATKLQRENRDEGAQTVFPPPQELPFHGQRCSEDRLQGRASAAALHLRARQNRSVAHHRRIGEKATRTGARDQTRPLPRAAAVRGRGLMDYGVARVRPGPRDANRRQRPPRPRHEAR